MARRYVSPLATCGHWRGSGLSEKRPRNSSRLGRSRRIPWAWWSTRPTWFRASRRPAFTPSVLEEMALLLEGLVRRRVGLPLRAPHREIGPGEHVAERTREELVAHERVERLGLRGR